MGQGKKKVCLHCKNFPLEFPKIYKYFQKGIEKHLQRFPKTPKQDNKNQTKFRSGVFIVNFEHISHLVLVFLLLTLNM